MKIYARIDAGRVAELLRVAADPATLFHHALRWVEVGSPPVEIGWIEGPSGFTAPPPPPAASAPAPPAPTLAELRAQVTDLAAKVAALAAK